MFVRAVHGEEEKVKVLQFIAAWVGAFAVLMIFVTLMKAGVGEEHDDDVPPPATGA